MTREAMLSSLQEALTKTRKANPNAYLRWEMSIDMIKLLFGPEDHVLNFMGIAVAVDQDRKGRVAITTETVLIKPELLQQSTFKFQPSHVEEP